MDTAWLNSNHHFDDLEYSEKNKTFYLFDSSKVIATLDQATHGAKVDYLLDCINDNPEYKK